jgi:glutathione S-transferase
MVERHFIDMRHGFRKLSRRGEQRGVEMISYLSPAEAIAHNGLRLVLVQGLPSPWGQAVKTIFEIKGLDFVVAPLVMAGTNEEIVAWSGQNSAPVVAWKDEAPINKWIDILHLAERLAPEPALIPDDAWDRAVMFGLSNELFGELGIGWCRRLQIIGPALNAARPPEFAVMFSEKYGYNRKDAEAASARIVDSLNVFATQLEDQRAQGSSFLVGDMLSAVDIYFTAMMNLVAPLPKEQCPMPDAFRPSFTATDPAIVNALSPILLEHRQHIFDAYFRNPMEF